MYRKNTASQKLEVFAFDYTTGAPKTGDAANITAYVNIDDAGYNALGDTSASEVDSTNKKGLYLFDLTQGETNGTKLAFFAKSSTSNISVIARPPVSFTQPATGFLAPATASRTLVVDSSGLADANMVKVGPSGSGTAQTAADLYDNMLAFWQLGVRTDAAIATDRATQLSAINANQGSGAGGYDNTAAATVNTTKWGGVTVPTLGTPAGASIMADIAALLASIQGTKIRKNAALSGFEFFMVLSSDHITGATGQTITATRSIDGAAFASCANSASEVSSGVYKIDLAAADLNGNVITLKFTSASADPRLITIITQNT